MPISKDYQTVICHTKKEGKAITQTRVMMTYITNNEEKTLDKSHKIKLVRNDSTFEINSDNILAFGNVDLHTGTDDYEGINEIIDFNDIVHVPANYNYDNHTCTVPYDVKGYRTYETNNIAAMAQYAHGKLGKPKKVVIFEITTKKW